MKGEDEQDRDIAGQILHEEYQPRILGYIYNRLGTTREDAEALSQEVWLDFIKRVRVEGLREGVSQLLFGRKGIATRRVIDAIRRRQVEISLESNFPLVEEENAGQVRREDNPVEELYMARETTQQSRRFFQHVIDTQLTDCQRVAWIMVQRFEYDRDVVARLMGKKRADIDQAISNANMRLRRYRDSGDYDVDLAHWEMKVEQPLDIAQHRSQGKVSTIERFLNPRPPRLTPDELRPLGISREEFEAKFITSLRLEQSSAAESKPGQVSLLVMSWYEYLAMNSFLNRASELLHKGKESFSWNDVGVESLADLKVFELDEFLMSIEIDDGNVCLTPLKELRHLTKDSKLYPPKWSLSDPGFHIVKHSARVSSVSLVLDVIEAKSEPSHRLPNFHWSYFRDHGSSNMNHPLRW